MRWRNIWRLLKATFVEWQLKQVSVLASSLAYYTVFSLAPLLIIVIAIVGILFGEEAAQGRIVEQLQSLIGREGAEVIETAIANSRLSASDWNSWQLWLNLGILIFGASNVFVQLQRALNRVWEVKPAPKFDFTYFVRKRILSFAMVLVIAFLLLVSFVFSAVLSAIFNYLGNSVVIPSYFWQVVNFITSFGVITLLFALIYKVLPDAKVSFRDTAVGATVTAVLFVIGQFLFGIILGRTSLGSAYGVAGSLVVVITWIYYSAQILLIGAEFTQVYARRYGRPIVPNSHAVRVIAYNVTANDLHPDQRSPNE